LRLDVKFGVRVGTKKMPHIPTMIRLLINMIKGDSETYCGLLGLPYLIYFNKKKKKHLTQRSERIIRLRKGIYLIITLL